MEEFPPGTYTFRITGYIHSKSDYTTIEMTLVDPCPTTQLTLESYYHFPNMFHALVYSEPQTHYFMLVDVYGGHGEEMDYENEDLYEEGEGFDREET